MQGEYESKNEELGNIIEKLFCINSNEDIENICQEFDKIYLDETGEVQENFRHEYASISGKIRELTECDIDGICPYDLRTLLDNIGYVYDYAVQNEKKYIKNLFKLKDHIGLEAGRIDLVQKLKWEIMHSKESIAIQLEDLHKLADALETEVSQTNDLVEKSTEQSTEIENRLVQLNEMSDSVAEKMEDVHRDSVSILGIFASIVLSFTAGVGFSSSVLENFHQGSPYRLIAVMIGLAVVIINLISVLMMYIDKIKSVTEKTIKYPVFLIIIDVVCGALFLLDFIAYKFNWI